MDTAVEILPSSVATLQDAALEPVYHARANAVLSERLHGSAQPGNPSLTSAYSRKPPFGFAELFLDATH